MNNLLKCLLVAATSIYITGCSFLGQADGEIEYITPVRDVSLSIGESAIVHGAMENCGRAARSWLDVSYLLPYSDTGFFSNAGNDLMKSDKCSGLSHVLAVRFTANKIGSESLTVFGDPMNIVVSDKNITSDRSINFLQSGIPNPDVSKPSESSPEKTDSSKPSMLGSMFGTLGEWFDRDVK